MAFRGTERPRPRWHHAATTIEHLVIVTLPVEPDRVRRQVHPEFEPLVVRADGADAALVSVVAFVAGEFRFRGAPFVRVTAPLVDYRTYGSVAGEPGVFVFGSVLDHPTAVVPRLLWRMPWRREGLAVDGRWGDDRSAITVRGDRRSGLVVEVVASGGPVATPAGFAGPDESIEVLTHPMVGWYAAGPHLHRYGVWHDVLDARPAAVVDLAVPELDRLDLGGAGVHSALAVRRAHFDVHTPPRRVT